MSFFRTTSLVFAMVLVFATSARAEDAPAAAPPPSAAALHAADTILTDIGIKQTIALVVPGMMTELVAKVKIGKTTFAMEGLRAFIDGDEAYCGQAIVKSGRVLYITEEGRATFHEAMQRYGLWKLDDEFVIVYDFEILDHALDDAVSEMIRLADEHQVDVG